MQTYLVGGAVRDHLLNLPIHERDWVVVGASVEEMQAQGFKQVGKDFPVFIHPSTGEEYALARTERKTTKGHTGFIVHSSPEITLQEDLFRRDLTINAIAQDENGALIDPYNGQQDLEDRVLRHVSPAFAEDPLRVLRVARFAAKFHHLQFKINADTLQLMQEISRSDELQYLSAERIWQETRRALETDHPEIYFFTLLQSGSLQSLAPEFARALDATEKQELLTRINKIQDTETRYIFLVALACQQQASFSIELANSINIFFSCPRNLQEACMLTVKYIHSCSDALALPSIEIYHLLVHLDGFRRSDRCASILKSMYSVVTMLNFRATASLDFLSWLLPRLTEIKLTKDKLQELGGNGEAIAASLTNLRCDAIDDLRKRYVK